MPRFRKNRFRRLSQAFAASALAFVFVAGWHAAPASQMLAQVFPDVKPSRPDYNAIMYVEFRGAMTGYDNGNFGPDDTIKRAEIATLLVRARVSASVVDACIGSPFPDVDAREWYAKYICTARSLGYVSGYPDGKFRPGQAITAAEVSKIMAIGFGLDTATTQDPNKWYMPYVEALIAKKALPSTLRTPDQLETRGEVAQTLATLLPPTGNDQVADHGAASEPQSQAPAGNPQQQASAPAGGNNASAIWEVQQRLIQEILNAQNHSAAGMRPTPRSSAVSTASAVSQPSSSAASSSAAISQPSSATQSSAVSSSVAASSQIGYVYKRYDWTDACSAATQILNLGYENLFTASLDAGEGYLYVAGSSSIRKISLSTFTLEGSLLAAAEGESITAAAIDSTGRKGYFVTTNFTNTNTTSRLIRVNMDTFTVESILTLEDMYHALNMALDVDNERAIILGYDRENGRKMLTRINLDTFAQSISFIINNTNTAERALALDTPNGFAYVASAGGMKKVRLATMQEAANIPAVRAQVSLRTAFVDVASGIGYFGNVPSGQGSIFGVNLGPFTIANEREMEPGNFNQPPTALSAFSPSRGIAYYFGGNGEGVRVQLANINTYPGALSLRSLITGGRGILSLAEDDDGGYLYMGTTATPNNAIVLRVPMDWACDEEW